MKCNCGNWDDNSPCEIHTEKKLSRSETCEHHIYVFRVYRRSVNLKWFYTIAKDALKIFESRDFDTKAEVLKEFETIGGVK